MNAPDARAVIRVSVEPLEGQSEALVFDVSGSERRIYSESAHNLTPAQSARILKLRLALGERLSFETSSDAVRATVEFSDLGGAKLTYLAPDGAVCWSVDVLPEHVVPDTPEIAPGKRPVYRWLAAAFALFLFVLTAFLLFALVGGGPFVERAAFGFIAAVVASIIVLQLVRRGST